MNCNGLGPATNRSVYVSDAIWVEVARIGQVEKRSKSELTQRALEEFVNKWNEAHKEEVKA